MVFSHLLLLRWVSSVEIIYLLNADYFPKDTFLNENYKITEENWL